MVARRRAAGANCDRSDLRYGGRYRRRDLPAGTWRQDLLFLLRGLPLGVFRQSRGCGGRARKRLNLDDLRRNFAERGYIAGDEFTTSIELMLALEKPLLIEGPAGVGKTE